MLNPSEWRTAPSTIQKWSRTEVPAGAARLRRPPCGETYKASSERARTNASSSAVEV